jgi:uncharacterized protein (TIGR03435 family)
LTIKLNSSPEPLKVPITGDALSPEGIIGHSVAMEYLTWWLGQRLQDGRPVIDKTGLEGYYDFKLSYMPELPPDASDRPNFFQALREQLGLRLEPQKGTGSVIDSIETPATN